MIWPPPETTRSARILAAVRASPRLAIGLALLVIFVALRLYHLDADPPGWAPNHARIYELFTDPPAKSYEARNWALFGAWAASPADGYQFWRIQAPVWVYPLAGFYRLFGVGYAQLRVFSTLCAASGLCAVLALAAQRLRGWAYLLAGAFLTFNYYYVIYGRSGLLEALLNTFVVLTVLFLHLAQRRLAWLLAAQWALVLAFLTKQTGIYLLPLALAAGTIAYARQARRAPRWLRVAPVAQAAALTVGLSWYVLRDAYWRTVTWNYGHMIFNNGGAGKVALSRFPLGAAVARLFQLDTWDVGYFSLFPVAGLLALLEVARVLHALRRRRVDAWEILVVAWFASSFGVLLLTPLLWVHYRLILFPPVALLAASLVGAAFDDRWVARRAWIQAFFGGGALALEVLTHGTWLHRWARWPMHDMHEATQVIREVTADEGLSFAGMWAGPLLFETRNRYYYIKEIFNADGPTIASLHLTHLIEVQGEQADLASLRIWQTHPVMMRFRKQLVTFHLRGRDLGVYQLRTPGR